MFPPSRLYAILDTGLIPTPRATKMAAQLLGAGVRLLQYRHKGPFTRRRWEECRAIAELSRQHGAQFLVNDRADVALLCGAAGVHVGQQDLPPEKARRVQSAVGRHQSAVGGQQSAGQLILGYSTHTVEQAREGDRLPVDYLAIGPVFPTRTKEQPDPVVGLETVAAVRAAVSKPLVAIGGITLENARAVLETGADVVAVARDLLAAKDIQTRARQFLEAVGG